MKRKRYLVAGGAGFIGSHIADSIVKNGSKVLAIDNLLTGCEANIEHLLDYKNFSFIKQDINDDFESSFSPDVIINLASIANPKDYEENPLKTLTVNSDGNRNLLKLAEQNKSRYMFFSSSEVYGHQKKPVYQGLKETNDSKIILNHKRSPYFIGKMFGEEIVKNTCIKNNLEYIIIRPFNIYGPRMDNKSSYGRVIPNFIRWALEKKTLRVNGDGKQVRSFCHIDDFIKAIETILEMPNFSYPILNIGNPDPISIIKLAKKINRITQNESGFEFTSRYKYEPDYRMPDITRIKNWLGWFPKTDLDKGLSLLIEREKRRYR